MKTAITKLTENLDFSINALSGTMSDYGKGKLQAFRDVRFHIQNELPNNESALIKQVEEMTAMLEKTKEILSRGYELYPTERLDKLKEITELLNRQKP